MAKIYASQYQWTNQIKNITKTKVKAKYLSYDLIKYISEFADLETCLNIILLNKWTTININVKYINTSYSKLNENLLKQKKYKNLLVLNATNINIQNLNIFVNL